MNAAKMNAWTPALPTLSQGAPRADAWGFGMGWRGYVTFSRLNALTDGELAARGLTRADLPRLALEAMRSDS